MKKIWLPSDVPYSMLTKRINLVATNGVAIPAFEMAGRVCSSMEGYMLQVDFVILNDCLPNDLLNGRSIILHYDVLLDLKSKELNINDPYQNNQTNAVLYRAAYFFLW